MPPPQIKKPNSRIPYLINIKGVQKCGQSIGSIGFKEGSILELTKVW
jgi:hypothetical protein